jgi:hypothetical protein
MWSNFGGILRVLRGGEARLLENRSCKIVGMNPVGWFWALKCGVSSDVKELPSCLELSLMTANATNTPHVSGVFVSPVPD